MNSKYIDLINQELDKGNYYIIDSIFKEYSELEHKERISLLKLTLKTNLYLNDEIVFTHNFPNYWELISENFYYFELEEKQLIISKIKKIKTWDMTLASKLLELLYKFFKETNDKEELYNNIMNHGKKFLGTPKLFQYKTSDYITAYNLIIIICRNNHIYEGDYRHVSIDFDDYLFEKLLLSISKVEDESQYFNYNYLRKNSIVGFLEHLLNNRLLLFKGKSVLPQKIYQFKIIQKVYIQYFTEVNPSDEIDQEILNIVLENIDFQYKQYGKNFGEFINKYHEFEGFDETQYVDGIDVGEAEWIKDYPYVRVTQPLSEEKIDWIVKSLPKEKVPDKIIDRSFSDVISIEGQNKEFIKELAKDDIWRSQTAEIEYLLKKLIENSSHRDLFEESIVKILVHGIDNDFISNDLAIEYVKAKSYKNKFSYLDKQLFNSLINNNRGSVNELNEILLNSIEVNELGYEMSRIGEHDLVWIELNDFINTSVGRYFEVLKNNTGNGYDEYIKEKIDDVQEINLRDYLIGMFRPLYNDIDGSDFSENFFIGYSHNYRLHLNSLDITLFKDQVISLLNKDIDDGFIVYNTCVVLLKEVDPQSYEVQCYRKNSFQKRVFSFIFKAYLEIGEETFYITNWLEWFLIKFKFEEEYLQELLHVYQEVKSSSKIETLFNIFKDSATKSENKLNDYMLQIINIENIDKNHNLEYLIKTIEQAHRNSLIRINKPFLDGIESILAYLSENKCFSEANDLLDILKCRIFVKDYERFKEHYLEK